MKKSPTRSGGITNRANAIPAPTDAKGMFNNVIINCAIKLALLLLSLDLVR